jgi:hypothetical protein
VNLDVVVVFSIGVAAGAIAIYLPWIHVAFKRYVVPCANANCPHHGPDIKRRINDINNDTRNGPTRPNP